MTETEQLRADIASLEAAQKVCFERSCGTIPELQGRIRDKQLELKKLEAEAAAKADPWAIEKQVIETLLKWSKATHGNAAARYARHLECQVDNISAVAEVFRRDFESARKRIAELESELARRPKVYCVKTHEGIATTGGFSKVPRVFLAESIEDEYGDGAQHIVPYTGQQA